MTLSYKIEKLLYNNKAFVYRINRHFTQQCCLYYTTWFEFYYVFKKKIRYLKYHLNNFWNKMPLLSLFYFRYVCCWMSHWRQQMVDGAEHLISCHWPAFLSAFSHLQLIQNSAPSTICWCQCDIRMGYKAKWIFPPAFAYKI